MGWKVRKKELYCAVVMGVVGNTSQSGAEVTVSLVRRAGASEGLGEWRAVEHLCGHAVGESGGSSHNAGKNPALGT